MGRLERKLDEDLIDRIDAGWTPSARIKPVKKPKPPRDVKRTVADMAEAANEIEESHKALRAISQSANLPPSDNTFGSLADRIEKIWLLSRNY